MVARVKAAYVPDRGDIIYLEFDPQKGREQKGKRSSLVLSPKSYNGKVGLAIMCPITNQEKGYPFEVRLGEQLSVTGVILSDQVKSINWRERNASFSAKAPQRVMDEVRGKILALLDP
jgi:mRNA interferase MazF